MVYKKLELRRYSLTLGYTAKTLSMVRECFLKLKRSNINDPILLADCCRAWFGNRQLTDSKVAQIVTRIDQR